MLHSAEKARNALLVMQSVNRLEKLNCIKDHRRKYSVKFPDCLTFSLVTMKACHIHAPRQY